MGFLSVGAGCKQWKWTLENMQKSPQKVLQDCVAAHRIKGKADRQAPRQVGPRWDERPGAASWNHLAPAACPGPEAGLSGFAGPVWVGTHPLVMRVDSSNQGIFTKWGGKDMSCWGQGGKMSATLSLPNLSLFPSVFVECSIRCYAIFHQLYNLPLIVSSW